MHSCKFSCILLRHECVENAEMKGSKKVFVFFNFLLIISSLVKFGNNCTIK